MSPVSPLCSSATLWIISSLFIQIDSLILHTLLWTVAHVPAPTITKGENGDKADRSKIVLIGTIGVPCPCCSYEPSPTSTLIMKKLVSKQPVSVSFGQTWRDDRISRYYGPSEGDFSGQGKCDRQVKRSRLACGDRAKKSDRKNCHRGGGGFYENVPFRSLVLVVVLSSQTRRVFHYLSRKPASLPKPRMVSGV